MAAINLDKVLLSGSTSGRNIKVTGTGTGSSVLIHTTPASPTLDEVWIYANNTSATSVVLTIEYGGTTDPDDLVTAIIPANTTTLVIPGWDLTGTLSINAFADTPDVINVNGFVNRRTNA